ncbi:MAG: hypothetical protein M1827_007177 [Pycnora praestabilis]|nr:MAG: hypothetical protein M1827_007177 [Pycnora praestabilis]
MFESIHKKVEAAFLRSMQLLMNFSDLLVRHNRLAHSTGNVPPPSPSRSFSSKRTSNPINVASELDYPGPSSIWQNATTPLQRLNDQGADASPDLCNGTASVLENSNDGEAEHVSDTLDTSNPSPSTLLDVATDDAQMFANPSMDDFSLFLDSITLPANLLSSTFQFEQPLPCFSPEPMFFMPNHYTQRADEDPMNAGLLEPQQSSFSRFGSRLPSLEPEEPRELVQPRRARPYPLSEVSNKSREAFVNRLNEFCDVIPHGFILMSRHALSRHLIGYITGFHEHLPFLHIQTMSIETTAVELVLAIAAVGAQYCREPEKSMEIYQVAKSVSMERIRRRDYKARTDSTDVCGNGLRRSSRGTVSSGNGESYVEQIANLTPKDVARDANGKKIETAQALLLLMAMATWSEWNPPAREALAIRSLLETLVRDEGLGESKASSDITWESWIEFEGIKRTKFIIFCFFNLHSIVFDIPPMILNGEIGMTLPCTQMEWKAPNAAAWCEIRRLRRPEPKFQDAFQGLFGDRATISEGAASFSSLGGYILIHALIQHVWLLQQLGRCQPGSKGALLMTEATLLELENALKSWQYSWTRNPESSVDPLSPHGPLSSNSSALLRLAYIRINIDTGPARSLGSWDPFQIATSIRNSPPIKRSKRMTRAALHCAHALSIPIKLGINFVAHTQMFFWSTQHALCSLECALLLTKWLESITIHDPEPALSEEEKKLLNFVIQMVAETEYDAPREQLLQGNRHLSALVVRLWAKLFRSDSIWQMIDVIGRSLKVYADMLES